MGKKEHLKSGFLTYLILREAEIRRVSKPWEK